MNLNHARLPIPPVPQQALMQLYYLLANWPNRQWGANSCPRESQEIYRVTLAD
jgi:hypothetical protein